MGNSAIMKSSVVRNFGSYNDDKLSMNSHINKVCNASFYYLHNIRQIRKHLSRDSSETLIHAFVSSWLDYCNSLLYGLPEVQIDKIKRVQNTAARLIFEQPRFCHITPVLSQLHWLPIKYCTEFKILLMTFKAIHGIWPWCQIIFANWSAKGNQLDVPSDPAKKLCLRFQAARYSQHLMVQHSFMRPQSSGTTYLAKYPALTLCQILNAMWKHTFLNKLLICSSVFVSFILLFITYCYFISFLNLSTCL